MHRVRIVAVASWTLITTGLKLNRYFIEGNIRCQHGIFKGLLSMHLERKLALMNQPWLLPLFVTGPILSLLILAKRN